MAATREAGELRLQPVFCLMQRDGAREPGALHEQRRPQDRRVDGDAAHGRRSPFDDAGAFANANTLAELQQLQRDG